MAATRLALRSEVSIGIGFGLDLFGRIVNKLSRSSIVTGTAYLIIYYFFRIFILSLSPQMPPRVPPLRVHTILHRRRHIRRRIPHGRLNPAQALACFLFTLLVLFIIGMVGSVVELNREVGVDGQCTYNTELACIQTNVVVTDCTSYEHSFEIIEECVNSESTQFELQLMDAHGHLIPQPAWVLSCPTTATTYPCTYTADGSWMHFGKHIDTDASALGALWAISTVLLIGCLVGITRGWGWSQFMSDLSTSTPATISAARATSSASATGGAVHFAPNIHIVMPKNDV